MLRRHMLGLQHIGIPTFNVAESVKFYQRLGFTVLFEQHAVAGSGTHVVFLECGGIVVECYEAQGGSRRSGAIDHIAIRTGDIDACYDDVVNLNLTVVTDGIGFLPYFENGIRYFIISGYNGERIEFTQEIL